AVDGSVMPGFVSSRLLPRSVHPAGLFDRLHAAIGVKPREIAWDMEKEQLAVNAMPHSEYEDWIRFHIEREKRWFQILRHLMMTEPTDLTAVVFDGVDKLQHLAWGLLDPTLVPARADAWQRKTREACLEYFRLLDGFISEIVSILPEDSRVFIASDHGFRATW